MDVKALREKVRVSKGNLVPSGTAHVAVETMIRDEPMLFRGWNTGSGMFGPDQAESFQVTVRSTIIHDRELETLSEVAKEFGFNYYIDALNIGNPKDPFILIRCRMYRGQ